MPRGKFDGIPAESLFSLPAAMPSGSTELRRGTHAAGRSVTWGRCPRHTDPRPIGLIRSGTHLTWRPHEITTWSGARLACDASGVRLCSAPARPVPGTTTPTCPCEELCP